MNDQLQAQIAEYLKAILATAKDGAAFVADQAPLVVQEKIAYGRAYETTFIVLFMLGIVVGGTLAVRAARRLPAYEALSYHEKDGQCFAIFPPLIGGGAMALWGVMGFGMNIGTTLQVWFAPRLYILEWALSLVKK